MLDAQLSCFYSHRLINRLISLDPDRQLNLGLVKEAMYWAKKYHGDQKRKSGEPYYTHPFEVAYMIAEYNITTNVIVTSILHDIIEDTEVTAGMIVDKFGWRIGEMVDALTRDRPDGTKLSVEEILNNAYKKDDKEVLLVKLFDRLHNVLTIKYMKSEKRKKLVKRTFAVFLILAESLEQRKLFETIYNQVTRQFGIAEIISSKLSFDQNYSLPCSFLSK